MSKYNNFVSFVDYTDFSFFKSLFWGNSDKKENDKKDENKNKNKNKIKIGLSKSSNKYSFNEKQKKLILQLEAAIDDYLYRKKVKNLIKILKDNYMIISTANIPNLFLNIIRTKGIKQYKLKYEPILKQNITFLPRKIYRNKKKLKFTFSNIKKEIFIEPQYQTDYEDGTFVNIIDLQELKEKEYKNEEDFQKFLANYIKNKNKNDNTKIDNNEKIEESKVEENTKDNNKIHVKKKKVMYNIKLFENKQLSNDNNFNIKVKRKKYKSKSQLKNKDISLSGIKSILKERSAKKIKVGRQITFGCTQFSY